MQDSCFLSQQQNEGVDGTTKFATPFLLPASLLWNPLELQSQFYPKISGEEEAQPEQCLLRVPQSIGTLKSMLQTSPSCSSVSASL